jgi:transposase
VKNSYSEEFKRKLVTKLLLPGGPTLMDLSREAGVHCTSLRHWVKFYGSENTMNKKTKKFGPTEKFKILLETAALDDNQLGEYIRKNGLHSSQLDEWKQETLAALKSHAGRPQQDPEVKALKIKEKNLEKEIYRKDRALAEMSARIILLKKSHLIWGDAEEDE